MNSYKITELINEQFCPWRAPGNNLQVSISIKDSSSEEQRDLHFDRASMPALEGQYPGNALNLKNEFQIGLIHF